MGNLLKLSLITQLSLELKFEKIVNPQALTVVFSNFWLKFCLYLDLIHNLMPISPRFTMTLYFTYSFYNSRICRLHSVVFSRFTVYQVSNWGHGATDQYWLAFVHYKGIVQAVKVPSNEFLQCLFFYEILSRTWHCV
jgi:hypothetical protein